MRGNLGGIGVLILHKMAESTKRAECTEKSFIVRSPRRNSSVNAMTSTTKEPLDTTKSRPTTLAKEIQRLTDLYFNFFRN